MANLIYLYNLANIDTKDFVVIKNEIVEDNFEVKNSPVSVDDNNFEEFEENDNDSDYVNGYESPAKPKRNPKIENNTGSKILRFNFKRHSVDRKKDWPPFLYLETYRFVFSGP